MLIVIIHVTELSCRHWRFENFQLVFGPTTEDFLMTFLSMCFVVPVKDLYSIQILVQVNFHANLTTHSSFL